jgi:glycosyltransferase involved in cell wall biosynthesis
VSRPCLAFVLPNLGGGGAERVALTLIQTFVDRGYSIDLVLLRHEGELLPLLPPQVNVIDLRAPKMRMGLLPLMRYLRRTKPRSIHVSMWPLTTLTVAAHRLARSRSRLLLTDHTTLSKHFEHLGYVQSWLMRLSIRLTYPLADERLGVSNGAADDLAAFGGIPRSSISVIYNPVTMPDCAPGLDLSATNGEALWGVGSARILTVGNLKKEKNHELLIRAFAQIARVRPAKLIILGEGPMRNRLEQVAIEEGVGDRVELPGFVADPWPYYHSAQVFALSSDLEGYPLVLIEAMKCGLQIVSTDCRSGPREILAGGTYGTLVRCADARAFASALENSLDHPMDRARLRNRGDELAGPGIYEQYLDLMLGAEERRGTS